MTSKPKSKAMAGSGLSRNWTELPDDLLATIADGLSVPDYLRFGVVCRAWRSARAGRRSLQFPWLMLAPKNDTNAGFLDPSTGECYTIPIPEAPRRRFLDSKDGWLLALDSISDVYLLNPLTHARIHLPPLSTFPGVQTVSNPSQQGTPEWNVSYAGGRTLSLNNRELLRKMIVERARLCCSPAEGFSLITVAIIGLGKLAFARAGDKEWSLLSEDPRNHYSDVMQYEQKINALTIAGEVHAWDLSGPSPRLSSKSTDLANEKGCKRFHKYLVDSCGDLLQVWRNLVSVSYEGGKAINGRRAVRVFKLDKDGATWSSIRCLRNCSLFVGNGQCISVPASAVAGLKPSRVYLGEICEVRLGKFLQPFHVVGSLDLEDGSFNKCHPRGVNRKCYRLPNIWFTPNFF